uniref:E2 ubiquitin-conjugating enzyme n=1 Tax=Strigamia maritima TaxID=126957 RepID=T1J244_STRMM
MAAAKQEFKFRDFLHENFKCYFCNGFYGPCFGEPVCGTCHLFLFPEDINLPEDVMFFAEVKTDDGDSGTEEPTEFYCNTRSHKPKVLFNNLKPDKLAEKITALTCPKDKDCLPEGLVDVLPPEVLLLVFSFLDDISLWNVSQVCKRWRQLLEAESAQEQWQQFTLKRWPLFRPLYPVQSWRTIYTKLVESAPCKLCLQQRCVQLQPPRDIHGKELAADSWRRNRLRTELKTLRSDPPDGIEAIPLDHFCCHWQASITGPVGSPYEGGNFYLYLQIPQSYPMRPPVVRFITKIFHPNVSRHGDIGIDSIHHNWSLALTISKVLISIQSLLTDPYCKVCMEPEIGRLFIVNRKLFDEYAKLWTWNYAMHDGLMPSKQMDQFWRNLQKTI